MTMTGNILYRWDDENKCFVPVEHEDIQIKGWFSVEIDIPDCKVETTSDNIDEIVRDIATSEEFYRASLRKYKGVDGVCETCKYFTSDFDDAPCVGCYLGRRGGEAIYRNYEKDG